MNAWTGIAIAVVVGLASALQTAMLGALGRGRAPAEAAWVSLLGSVVGISAVMLIRTVRGDSLMPPPLDRAWPYLGVLFVGGVVLALSMRGVPWYLGVAGMGGVIFLATAAFLVPRLGVALFFGATTAGSVVGALLLDQMGAFGATPTPASVARVGGMALIMVGVVVARLAR